MKTDKLTCKLREIEQEIDVYYKSNPLVNLSFATAAWSLLAFGEEIMLKEQNDGRETQLVSDEHINPRLVVYPGRLTPQENEAIADNLINALKAPMYWLYSDCKSGN